MSTKRFKIQDKVIVTRNFSDDDGCERDFEKGETFTVSSWDGSDVPMELDDSHWIDQKFLPNFRLVSSTSPFSSMSITEFAKAKLLPADEKVLRDSGLKDADGWTDDAKELLIQHLIDKNYKDVLLPTAKEYLKEQTK